MEQIGYSLVRILDGVELAYWGDTFGQVQGRPDVLVWPDGAQTHSPEIGMERDGSKLVERHIQYGSPQSIEYDGTKVVVTRPAPEPVSVPPSVVATAIGITVDSGDVQSIGGSYNVVGALYIDVGQIMLIYLNPVAETNFVSGSAGAMSVITVEATAEYCLVETRNASGVLADASRIDLVVTAL